MAIKPVPFRPDSKEFHLTSFQSMTQSQPLQSGVSELPFSSFHSPTSSTPSPPLSFPTTFGRYPSIHFSSGGAPSLTEESPRKRTFQEFASGGVVASTSACYDDISLGHPQTSKQRKADIAESTSIMQQERQQHQHQQLQQNQQQQHQQQQQNALINSDAYARYLQSGGFPMPSLKQRQVVRPNFASYKALWNTIENPNLRDKQFRYRVQKSNVQMTD